MKAIDRLIVQMQAYFITENGDVFIPSIAIRAMESYKTYQEDITDWEKKKTILLKSCLMILAVVCLIGLIALGKSLNKVQS